MPSPDVTTFELDDDLVLYDARGAEAHVLNATAARIWQLCDGTRTIASVAGELATTYALDQAEAQGDVEELVASLEAAGLLTAV